MYIYIEKKKKREICIYNVYLRQIYISVRNLCACIQHINIIHLNIYM